jgi:predicted Fe-S protein YdhL (DUF1289 family)
VLASHPRKLIQTSTSTVALTKRTPCVGICSTTYGDLVCRGCKRFAHEVVQWNGYDAEQQGRVWHRLHTLRDEVVRQHLHVEDAQVFSQFCQSSKFQEFDDEALVYEVTRHLVVESQPLSVAGLLANEVETDALEALKIIDAEIYLRSLAHYERNFKMPL